MLDVPIDGLHGSERLKSYRGQYYRMISKIQRSILMVEQFL